MMIVRQVLRQPLRRLVMSRPLPVVSLPNTRSIVCLSHNLARQPRTSSQRLPKITMQRGYAVSTLKFAQSTLSESEYHALSDQCLDALTDSLENLVEEYDGPEADSFEAEYSSGVLNLRLGSHGTYVINKQPPNKQIWLSSPRSGPKRFDYDSKQQAWFMLKEGEESNLRDLLNAELSDIFGQSIEVNIGNK